MSPPGHQGSLRRLDLLYAGLCVVPLTGFLACLACLAYLTRVRGSCWATAATCQPHPQHVFMAMTAFAGAILIAQVTINIGWRSHTRRRHSLLAGYGLQTVIAGTIYITVFAGAGGS